MYGRIGQKLQKSTSGKYQNDPYVMKTDQCDTEDYVIPIYSETSGEPITCLKK